jgi:hypothetical protein
VRERDEVEWKLRGKRVGEGRTLATVLTARTGARTSGRTTGRSVLVET